MPASSAAIREDEARVDSMVAYLRYSIVKTKSLPSLVVHAILLILIGILVFSQPMQRELFDFEEDRLLQAATVRDVSSPKEAIAWFISVIRGLQEMRRGNSTQNIDGTVPIAMVTFASRASVGNAAAWIERCEVPSQLGLIGAAHVADLLARCERGLDPRDVFVEFPFTTGADFTAVIDSLEARSNVDDDSQISAQFFFYTSNVDSFVSVAAAYDTELSRLLLRKTPFWIHHVPSRAHSTLELIAWIVVLLCCVHIFWWHYYAVKVMQVDALRIPLIEAIGLEQAFDVCLIGLLAACVGHYGALLQRAHGLDSQTLQTDQDLFRFLSDYSVVFAEYFRVLGWATVLTVLRTMYFLRHWTRFSVVSETIISSIPSLTGCTVIFFAVVVTFSVTAKHLFGTRVFECRSFYESFKFLMILVFREGSLDYAPFDTAAPISAPAFFLGFAFLAQVVILNIVVGILASSFSASVSTMELVRLPNWSLPAVARDAARYIRRFFVVVANAPSDISSAAVNGELTYVAERRELLASLLKCTEAPESLLRFAHVRALAPHTVRDDTIRAVISNARHHVGTADAVARQSKTAVQAMLRFERMEAQLWRQAKMVYELHNAVVGGAAVANAASATGGASAAAAGAAALSSGLSREVQNAKQPAGAANGGERHEAKVVAETVTQVGAKTKSVSQRSAGVVAGVDALETRLTQLEATLELLRAAIPKAAGDAVQK